MVKNTVVLNFSGPGVHLDTFRSVGTTVTYTTATWTALVPWLDRWDRSRSPRPGPGARFGPRHLLWGPALGGCL